MSSSSTRRAPTQRFYAERLGYANSSDGASITINGDAYVMRGGIPRQLALVSADQEQTGATFEDLWRQAGSVIDGEEAGWSRRSLAEKFPGFAERLRETLTPGALVLDAGCGRGAFGFFMLEDLLDDIHYLGVDLSASVDVALELWRLNAKLGEFMQADIARLPFGNTVRFDLVLSLGVLHHTDDVGESLKSLSRHVRPGGQLWFWVYRKPPPLRELADTYLRGAITTMAPGDALTQLTALTELGQALARLGARIEVPAIALLGVPAGQYDLQQFVFDYLIRVFYRAELSDQRNLLAAWDWYRPALAHTHTEQEVRRFCVHADLDVEWLSTTPSGISVFARARHRG
jgi:SAM-dependent methyltransferase